METVLIAAMAYIATNIDDIFIITLLFARADTAGRRHRIIWGRYAGIFILTAVSILGAGGARAVMQEYVHLLGIVPLITGVKAAADRIKNNDNSTLYNKNSNNMLLYSTGMTIASGGDNIGVYIPLMAGMGSSEIWLLCAVFAVMTGLWCAVGYYIIKLPPLQNILEKHKKILVPVVYILLAVYILMG